MNSRYQLPLLAYLLSSSNGQHTLCNSSQLYSLFVTYKISLTTIPVLFFYLHLSLPLLKRMGEEGKRRKGTYILTSTVCEWEQKGQSKTFWTLRGPAFLTTIFLLFFFPIVKINIIEIELMLSFIELIEPSRVLLLPQPDLNKRTATWPR